MRKHTETASLGSAPRGAERQTNGGVQSVVRALRLIDALGESRGEVGIADLSKRVGLHVSTAHRLLATLIQQGYCRQNPETGRYALGAKLFHLGEVCLGQLDLRGLARPFLERLSRETGETAAEGVALDREECEEGATCIATPVQEYAGRYGGCPEHFGAHASDATGARPRADAGRPAGGTGSVGTVGLHDEVYGCSSESVGNDGSEREVRGRGDRGQYREVGPCWASQVEPRDREGEFQARHAKRRRP